MSDLVEEMPLTLLDMAKPMSDDGNDTDFSEDHPALSGFSVNDLPSHGERAKYSSFTTGDLPDLAMELERTEGLPPLHRPFKAEDLATMSLPLTRTGSFKQLSLQERRDQFRRQSKSLVLEKLDSSVSQSCSASSLFALDLLSSTLPDPESSRHHLGKRMS